MKEFFYPTSVAIIGVSAKPTNLGRNIVANLVEYGFDGIVYAVGQSGGAIETRRIFRSVGDIPDHVDLAVIFTPAQTVPGILEECGQKGIRWAIIETAGFREYTKEGKQLEEQINQVAERYGIQFIGPNCIGAINMENGFCVPFPRLEKFIKHGDVSIITQSGGVGMTALNLLANEGLGLNKFVSIGNMLNKNAEDVLDYLIHDENTGVIFMYLESIGDGKRLMEIARRSETPILVFKANIGGLGQKIALSHTASLASDDRVVDAAFHQSGIIRVHDGTALGNNLKIFKLPPMKGKRLGVVSRSGGHAVMAADACELSGFELAQLPESFLREVERHFRASVIHLTNPLDLGDLFDLDLYAKIIEQTLLLEGVDGMVFLHTSLSEAENYTSRLLLDRIIELVQKYEKPVAYYLSIAADELNYLKQNYSFPIFTQVVETVRALEMSYYYYSQHEKIHSNEKPLAFTVEIDSARALIQRASAEKRDPLLSEAVELLQFYGIPVIASAIAENSESAAAAGEKLGYPLAMKVIAPQVVHKSDVGGVRLDIQDKNMLTRSYTKMIDRITKNVSDVKIEGVLLQPMVPPGRELILGGRQDPQFGPVVLLGVGGIFVEILEDVIVRVAPIAPAVAREMVENLQIYPTLKGARGEEPADIPAIIDAVLRLSQLLCDFPEVKEIDINPLRVFKHDEGVKALDARVILAH